MIRVLVFLLITLPAFAVVNSVTVYDRSGAAQTNRPITLARAFAKGEIANYARPRIGATPATLWQCDVKKRWNDGSLAFALVSFQANIPANGLITVYFENNTNPCSSGDRAACDAAGLDQSEMLDFNGGAWGASIETTFDDGASGFTHTFNGRTVLAAGHFSYWLRGPVVTEVIVEDASPSRSYDAGGSCATGCDPLQITLDEESVDVAGDRILFANHGLHNGERVRWQTATPGGLKYTMVYWVVNRNDNDFQLAHSPGGAPIDLTSTGSGTTALHHDYAHSTWTNDTTHRSLHPIFGFRFYEGWNGVRIHYELQNEWESHLQDQRYDVALKSGASLDTVEYSLAGVTQYAQTEWRKLFWDGSEPGAIHVDQNLSYLISAKVILPYDTKHSPDSSDFEQSITYWNNRTSGDEPVIAGLNVVDNVQYIGSLKTYFPATAGRPELGPLPRWQTRYLYAMSRKTEGPDLWAVVLGNADLSGQIPWHMRESVTGKYFVDLDDDGDAADDAIDAFGRVMSRDARPSYYTYRWDGGADNLDQPVAALSKVYLVSVDLAHKPDVAWLPWLFTGDWYYQRELQQQGAYALAYGYPTDCSYCSHGRWAFVNPSSNLRRVGWGLRDAAHAAWASTEGSPEESYFELKLKANAAIWEGMLDITDGDFYNTDSASRWYWGRNTVDGGLTNTLGFMIKNGNLNNSEIDSSVVSYTVSLWQHNFNLSTFRTLTDLEYTEFSHVAAKTFGFLISILTDSDYNPWLVQEYQMPAVKASDGDHFTTWSDVKNGFLPAYRDKSSWTGSACGGTEDYTTIARGVAALGVGFNNGQAAYDWISSHCTHDVSTDPRWGFVPGQSGTGQSGRGWTKFGGKVRVRGKSRR